VIFAPGHQPGGVVITEEKHKGLFINDLVGNCFADCNFQLILNPPRSNMRYAMEALRKCQKMNPSRVFLGHFGISKQPKKLIQGALDGMQKLLNIGEQCVTAGKPEDIATKVYDLKMLELEKLKARGPVLFDYLGGELIKAQSRIYAEQYLSNFSC
jgi:glyoxylase-like metal-dependent hydrolase (beta-lactamase superfamily II)